MQPAFREFARVVQSKREYVELFSIFGMNSEGWLQAEFLRFFALHEAVEEIKPQKQDTGTLGKRQLHDFWIKFSERTVWCEFKSFCTNYCGAPGKNITNRIDGILEAMAACKIVALIWTPCPS